MYMFSLEDKQELFTLLFTARLTLTNANKPTKLS